MTMRWSDHDDERLRRAVRVCKLGEIDRQIRFLENIKARLNTFRNKCRT